LTRKINAKHVCPNCGFTHVVYKPETGEVCCPNCGLVLSGMGKTEMSYASSALSIGIEETPEFIRVLNCCPLCGNDNPKFIYPNWPREGMIQCDECHKYWAKEKFYIQAKIVEHPIQIPNVCPKCGSIHIEKSDLTPRVAYINGFILNRLECFKCGFVSWFALRQKRVMIEPVKSWYAKRILSSYGDYRQRFKIAVQGPINYPASDILTPISETHYRVKSGEDEEDIVIPLQKLIRKTFKEYYRKEPYTVGYTKRERAKYLFEKTIPYHWVFRLFEHNKLIYEECLRLAEKLVYIDKRGKNWDYLALAILHIVLFLNDLRKLMPEMPKLWKQHIGRTFHWKTYRRHLEFTVAHTQPYVRNGAVIRKKPEVWVEQLMLWLED